MGSILLKTWTKVELSGQNDDNNRNIKDSMTIASYHGRYQVGHFKTLDAENKKRMHVTMSTEQGTLTMTLTILLEMMMKELFM